MWNTLVESVGLISCNHFVGYIVNLIFPINSVARSTHLEIYISSLKTKPLGLTGLSFWSHCQELICFT